ncbi:MAG: hypothetical protein RL076_390 [Chloroflexota bacterium]
MSRLLLLLCVCASLLASCSTTDTQGGMHDSMQSGDMATMMPMPNMNAPVVATVGDIRLSDAWVRTANQGDNSAGYFIINNSGNADTLIGVASDIATSTELHTVEKSDGMMRMRPVNDGIGIPSQGVQLLQPGAYHIMFIGLKRDLNTGERIEVTLTFAQAGDVTVPLSVR